MLRRNFTLLALAALVGTAHGQTYPSKPIHIIIPSTPGGGTDIIGRLMGSELAAMNGWQVVPENQPGAGTALGLAKAARSSNDGHVLAIGLTDNVTVAPLLTSAGYDPLKDLTPVALIATTPLVIVVPASSPLRTLDDMVRAAVAKPGKVSYGTSGTGGSVHLAMEMLQAALGFNMLHVPYKGSSAALADLAGQHLEVVGTSIPSAAPLIAAGKIRALAVTSAKRSSALPDVPAVAEAGYKDFNFEVYYGVMAPVDLPKPVLARLNSDFNKILQFPKVRATLLAQGLEPSPAAPERFAVLIKSDIDKAKAIIREAKIKVGQ